MKFFKKTMILLLITIFPLLMFNNCATIFKGTNDSVRFNSKPVGADIYINGQFAGNTPLKLSLKSNKTYFVEIKKDGYTSCRYQINNEIGAGWVILDIIGGLIPVAIDAVTGSWYYLEPDYLNCKMEKEGI
jgi:hypothetical protein